MIDWKETYNWCISDCDHFPWEEYGGVPMLGPVHTYLLKTLAHHISPEYFNFARGGPSFGELKNLCYNMSQDLTEPDGVILEIFRYAEIIEEKYSHDRLPRRREVFTFLRTCRPFLKDLEKMIEKKVAAENRYRGLV